jgi:hypothetical protein
MELPARVDGQGGTQDQRFATPTAGPKMSRFGTTLKTVLGTTFEGGVLSAHDRYWRMKSATYAKKVLSIRYLLVGTLPATIQDRRTQ